MRTPFVGHILDTFTFVDVDALSPYGRKQVTKAIKDLTKHPKSRMELFMNVHMEKLHVFLVRIADCECPNTRLGPIACFVVCMLPFCVLSVRHDSNSADVGRGLLVHTRLCRLHASWEHTFLTALMRLIFTGAASM